MDIPHQKILMCAPDHFGVDYVINPWMEGQKGKADPVLTVWQWTYLRERLAAHANLVFLPHQKGLPDQVFTANAGFVLNDKVVVSRFREAERQGEETHFRHWFSQNHFNIAPWPEDVFFEGAGDALLDRGTERIWVAHGFRSDLAAVALLEKTYDRPAVALRLVDPRFYHLDTCFCPLDKGFMLYFPSAFDVESQATIAKLLPPEKRIVLSESDALGFACNAVELNGHVYMNAASYALRDRLRAIGLTPVITPLGEFMKAGGAAKCLTLKLVET